MHEQVFKHSPVFTQAVVMIWGTYIHGQSQDLGKNLLSPGA